MKSSRYWLLAVFLLAQDSSSLPEEWTHWRWSRPIVAVTVGATELVETTLPPEVYARTLPGLFDIRVIDESGAEVPYIIESRYGRESQRWLNFALREVSHVPGEYTQALIDLGPGSQVHNQAVIDVDSAAGQFVARVEIAVSDDGRDWRVLRESEPIYRFAQQGTHMEVDYDNTSARWLRFRVRDERGTSPVKLPIVGGQVGMRIREPAELVELPVVMETRPESPRGESWWQMDLGSARVPALQVRFATETPDFYREVRVFASDDASTWHPATTGFIYRGAATRPVNAPFREPDTGGTENLTVEFPEISGRYWRIIVNDGDSTALNDLQISVWGVPRHVVFRQEPLHAYRLLYGNESSKPPAYDLQRLVSRDDVSNVAGAGLGAEQANSDWTDPRPWSEQYPVVLWVALSVAVAVLAWLAIRAMNQPAKKQP